ncbi:MAG: Gfo/Idh/MocA family oxidoreductase [Clostridia bacterium]|nr:Gfo/Idh/MocA family oxidoreductase [Clostridia bacterium]
MIQILSASDRIHVFPQDGKHTGVYREIWRRSRIHVLCEKPFTTDAKQAKELFSLAEEKGVYFAEAMWTWFSPVAHQVKKWLQDDEFGEIRRIKANDHMDVRRYAARLTDPNRAGGALLDIGVYPITYRPRQMSWKSWMNAAGKWDLCTL